MCPTYLTRESTTHLELRLVHVCVAPCIFVCMTLRGAHHKYALEKPKLPTTKLSKHTVITLTKSLSNTKTTMP